LLARAGKTKSPAEARPELDQNDLLLAPRNTEAGKAEPEKGERCRFGDLVTSAG
jgi:hypothetical protein